MLDLFGLGAINVLVCFVTIFIVRFLWSVAAVKSRLPGPPTRMFFGHMFELTSNLDRMHDWIYEMGVKYGKEKGLFQLAMPNSPLELYLTDDKLVKFIMENTETQDVGVLNIGPTQVDVFSGAFGHGSIFMKNGKDWSFRRKQYSYLFSMRSLRDVMFPRFQTCSEKILKRIEKYAESGEKFDIQDLFSRATLDAIIAVAFGQDLGCLDAEDTPAFMTAFDSTQHVSILRLRDPTWKIKRALKISYEKDFEADMKLVNDKIYNILEQRRRGNYAKDRISILDLFEERMKKDGFPCDDKILRDVTWDFMIAGRDTTACGSSWMTYYLATKPKILEKVREELKDKDLSDFRDVSLQLPYLNACCLETQRINPSVPNDAKYASKDFTFPNGVHVEEGTYLNFNPYGIGRSEEIWGDDVMEFKPERFIDGDKDYGVGKYPSFNGGPRLCLGKQMALLEMKSLVSQIFSNFDLEVVEDQLPITYIVTVLLWIKGGLWVRAKKRAE